MADAPTSYTTNYSFKKWNDGYHPGAIGWNSNWDAIDAAIHEMSDYIAGTSANTDKWSGTSVGLDPVQGRASLGLSNIANIGTGAVSTTEFNYLAGVTSGIQGQLNALSTNSHTHANKTYLDTINQPMGSSDYVAFGKITSNAAQGTAPFVVSSTTQVNNLNADLWDGNQFSDYLNQAVKTTSDVTHNSLLTAGNVEAGNAVIVNGNLSLKNSQVFRNKANSDWLVFASRNTSGTEAVYDLSNVGVVNGQSGHFTNWVFPSGIGAGAEIGVSGGRALLYGYDRTALAYIPMTVKSANILFDSVGGTLDFTNYSIATFASNLTLSGNLTVNGTGNNYFAGNVGVGTTSPQQLLHLAKDTSLGRWVRFEQTKVGSEHTYDITAPNYTGWGLYDNTNSAYRIVVDKDGNIGFGTLSPLAKVDMRGGLNVGTPPYNATTGQIWTSGLIGVGVASDNFVMSFRDTTNLQSFNFKVKSGGLIWADNGNNPLGIFSQDGKFSVGTTTTTERLNINGNTKQWGDIYSDNWNGVDPYLGYYIGRSGSVFSKITANELHVKAFIADLEMALAGSQIIAPSVAKLYSDFTVGGNLVVEEIPGFTGHVLVDGDYIRLRNQTRNDGGLSVVDIWGTVTYLSRNDTTKTQTYSFTKLAGSGTSVKAGTLALDYGVAGNGIYETVAIGPLGKTPYSQIATYATNPWTDMKIRSRIGDLTGIPTTTYGALKTFGIYTQDFFGEGNTNIVGTLTAGDAYGFGNTFYVGKIRKNLVPNSMSTSSEWGRNLVVSYPIITDPVYGPTVKVTPTASGNSGVYCIPAVSPNKIYTWSFWAKADADTQLLVGHEPALEVISVTTAWKKYSGTWTSPASPSGAFCFYSYTASGTIFYISQPQFEEGSNPTPYQPTDGSTPYGNGYGMWVIAGGAGGTMQNPIVEFSSAGMGVRNAGTITDVTNTSGSYIGNWQSKAGFYGSILNHKGLYGYQNNTLVMKIDDTGALFAGWAADSVKLTGGALTMHKDGIIKAGKIAPTDTGAGFYFDVNTVYAGSLADASYLRWSALLGVDIKASLFLLSSANISIGHTSGWFGANNILSYNANEVKLAGWKASGTQLTSFAANGYSGAFLNGGTTPSIGVSMDEFNSVSMNYLSSDNWGFTGIVDGDEYLHLGSGVNHIANWGIEPSILYNNLSAGNGVRLEASSALRGLAVQSGGSDVVKVGMFTNAAETYGSVTIANPAWYVGDPSGVISAYYSGSPTLTETSGVTKLDNDNAQADYYGGVYRYSYMFVRRITDVNVLGRTLACTFRNRFEATTYGSTPSTVQAYIRYKISGNGNYISSKIYDVSPVDIDIPGDPPVWVNRSVMANIPSGATNVEIVVRMASNGVRYPVNLYLDTFTISYYNKSIVELNEQGLKMFRSPINKIELSNASSSVSAPELSGDAITIGNFTFAVSGAISGDNVTVVERLKVFYKGQEIGFFDPNNTTHVF